jgi:hypothetical protein
MKKILISLSLIFLASCASAPFSSNNLANEGTVFALNKNGDKIIIYRRTSITRTISDPEVFRINGSDLILEKRISPPAGTISIVFDADDENFVITKYTGSDYLLGKLNIAGNESLIYRDQERLILYGVVKENAYLLNSQKINQEFSGRALIVSDGQPRFLTDLVRHNVNIVGGSVLGMETNRVLYGDGVKNLPSLLPKDYVSNRCSGGVDITCFRSKVLVESNGYSPKQLHAAVIRSTIGDCAVPDLIPFLGQVAVSRNGRVIIYGAISNKLNRDNSLYINNYSGKDCGFTMLKTKEAI